MNAEWNDIQVALNKGTIEKLDKETLEAFARVEPPMKGNPAFQAHWEYIQGRITRALNQLEAQEREKKEEARHGQALRVAADANHFAKWAIVIAVLALIVAIVQTFWR
jgi:hypothetical protein